MNFDLSITHDVQMVLIAAGLTLVVLVVGARIISASLVSKGRFANMVEVMVEFVRESIVEEFLGEQGKKWFGFFAALFFFLLFANILGKLPIPGLHSPTANINVTAALAVMVFLIAQGVGIKKLGPPAYFKKKFLLPGAPWWVQPLAVLIMPIVLLAEPFSLAVRLFANMTAGHMVLLTFATAPFVGGLYWINQSLAVTPLAALPFVLSVLLMAFELFVAFIQAFIFALLSAVYLSESMMEESH
jgi:F-type H+-transporting ATPase subunit a